MAFWPFWQSSSNKLAIFINSCIVSFYLHCLQKINSSSTSTSKTCLQTAILSLLFLYLKTYPTPVASAQPLDTITELTECCLHGS